MARVSRAARGAADRGRIERLLRDAGVGGAEGFEARAMAGGFGGSRLYDVHLPRGRRLVAKRLPESGAREAAFYRRGPAGGGAVAPRCFVQSIEPSGARWLLLEHAGEPIDSRALAGARRDPAARLLARIHALPPRGARPPWLAPLEAAAPYDAAHFRNEIERAASRLAPDVVGDEMAVGAQAAAARLRSECAERLRESGEAGESFVHGDFQGPNLLLGLDDNLLAIDWCQWGYGPSVFDLATATKEMGAAERGRFVAAYAAARGGAAAARTWMGALAALLPLRVFLGAGVLAHYARTDSGPRDARSRALAQARRAIDLLAEQPHPS